MRSNTVYDAYLMHHGVKGMHWGVRRYQPYEGSAKGREVGKAKVARTRRHGRHAKTAAKIAGVAAGAAALSIAAHTPTGRAIIRRSVTKAYKGASKAVPPGAKKVAVRVGGEVKIGAVDAYKDFKKPIGKIVKDKRVRKGADLVAKSSGTALGIMATGAAIYAGEEYVKYKYGEDVGKKIIQYGRQPVKKK